jgi:hypothetical protein
VRYINKYMIFANRTGGLTGNHRYSDYLHMIFLCAFSPSSQRFDYKQLVQIKRPLYNNEYSCEYIYIITYNIYVYITYNIYIYVQYITYIYTSCMYIYIISYMYTHHIQNKTN